MQLPHLNNLFCRRPQAEDLITRLGDINHTRIKKMLKWAAQTKLHLPIQPLYHRPTDLRPLQHSYHKILEIDRTHTPQCRQTSVTTASVLHPPLPLLLAPQLTSMLEVLSLTSPALLPQRDRDMDQEATAALLMLNTDRRGTHGGIGGRGMSVKDLLST
jgi:hypothetical protein